MWPMGLLFIMVIKRTKLYDPGAYLTTYKVFLLSNAMTLTSDPEKQYGSSINDEDEVYQLEVL
jgi:hypothetical protein